MVAERIEYVRPWHPQYQIDAVYCPERVAITEASTKSGKTHPCITWLFEQAVTNGAANRHFGWFAPVYTQSLIAYNRMKMALHDAAPDLYKSNDTDATITLLNGAVIPFKSCEKPDNLYGEDNYAAVIDEASRVREEAYHAIRSTLTATQGPLRIIGNVKGRQNWAYRLARRAEAGEPGMHYATYTAYDAIQAGLLNPAEVESAKRDLPEAVFNELYLNIPSDDGGNPFGLGAIQRSVAPLSEAEPVCWGWDLAKHVDWTVGVGLDYMGNVCRLERFQAPWDVTFRRIDTATGTQPAAVDSTGVGDPIVERLQRETDGSYEGYNFSQASKQRLMEGLALWLQQQRGSIPPGVLVLELEAFEYEYTRTGVRYSAPDGMHDDCVMALALAVYCFQNRRSYGEPRAQEVRFEFAPPAPSYPGWDTPQVRYEAEVEMVR